MRLPWNEVHMELGSYTESRLRHVDDSGATNIGFLKVSSQYATSEPSCGSHRIKYRPRSLRYARVELKARCCDQRKVYTEKARQSIPSDNARFRIYD